MPDMSVTIRNSDPLKRMQDVFVQPPMPSMTRKPLEPEFGFAADSLWAESANHPATTWFLLGRHISITLGPSAEENTEEDAWVKTWSELSRKTLKRWAKENPY